MFLIEYRSKEFVDAEKIEYININHKDIIFTLTGNSNETFTVAALYSEGFLEQLSWITTSTTGLTR